MWLVIIFACMTNGACGFIDSPPVYLESECLEMLQQADMALQLDPEIAMYDSKCLKVKVIEVTGS
jgi:hypothetical protein